MLEEISPSVLYPGKCSTNSLYPPTVCGKLLTHHCASVIVCDMRLVEGTACLSLSSWRAGVTKIDKLARMSFINQNAAPMPTLGPSTGRR